MPRFFLSPTKRSLPSTFLILAILFTLITAPFSNVGPFVMVPRAYATSVTFSYTGAEQTWVVPAGVTSITVDIQGAAGGNAAVQLAVGGKGGRIQGTLATTPGETLYIYVGQKPASGTSSGGFNGGGASGFSYYGYSGGGGGGASDIRQGGNTLGHRMGVAGGGGGSGGEGSTGGVGGNLAGGAGGAGGDSSGAGSGGQGTSGSNGSGGNGGGGATSSSGGSGGAGSTGIDGSTGSIGIGGAGGGPTCCSASGDSSGGGGGGGGGYYGGGGGEGGPATGSTVTSTGRSAGGGGGGTNYGGGLTAVTSTQGYASATGNGQVIFTYTDVPPTITTPTNTSITTTTATLGGNVTAEGTATVTGRGVCVGTSADPVVGGTCFTASGTTGIFTADATGLTPGTLYHYRAYATNSAGTSYTTDDTFTTADLSTGGIAHRAVNSTSGTASFTPTLGGSVAKTTSTSSGSATTKLTIPSGALNVPSIITITEPSEALAQEGTQALTSTQTLVQGSLFDYTATAGAGTTVNDSTVLTTFKSPLTLSITVPSESLAQEGTDPTNIAIHFFNTTTNTWVPLPTTYDAFTRTFSTTTTHFTLFALIATEGVTTVQEPIASTELQDGDLITTADSLDIYLVKIQGATTYKRLILNPQIFESYGFQWNQVKTVSQETAASFTTSLLAIEVNGDGNPTTGEVYEFRSDPNTDTGTKHHLDMTPQEFESRGYEWDSVFTINHTEAGSIFYGEGETIGESL